MLASWAAEGHPQYQAKEGSIVYISDVGGHLKPLFISTPAAPPASPTRISASLPGSFLEYGLTLAICAITAPGFVLSQAIDRFLRHKRRLAPNHQKRERWNSWVAMVFSTLGGVALILLSVFDVTSLPHQSPASSLDY